MWGTKNSGSCSKNKINLKKMQAVSKLQCQRQGILWRTKTETRKSALQVIEIAVHQGRVKIALVQAERFGIIKQGFQLSRIERESPAWTPFLPVSRQACKISHINEKKSRQACKISRISWEKHQQIIALPIFNATQKKSYVLINLDFKKKNT